MLVVSLIAVAVLAVPAWASAAIKIGQYDPSGSDTGSNPSLNREYVVIKNTGTKP